jgi:hypothetical protein
MRGGFREHDPRNDDSERSPGWIVSSPCLSPHGISSLDGPSLPARAGVVFGFTTSRAAAHPPVSWTSRQRVRAALPANPVSARTWKSSGGPALGIQRNVRLPSGSGGASIGHARAHPPPIPRSLGRMLARLLRRRPRRRYHQANRHSARRGSVGLGLRLLPGLPPGRAHPGHGRDLRPGTLRLRGSVAGFPVEPDRGRFQGMA